MIPLLATLYSDIFLSAEIISLLSVGTVRERAVMHILTAVKLLMIALSAAAVHYCGREVFPLLAASLALFIGDIISLR